MCLVILTREATLWTANLTSNAASKPAAASHHATAFTIHPATPVDLTLLTIKAPADSSAEAAVKQQLYGKDICYCPATSMYFASLGNAADEDQNVTWLMTIGTDGRAIGKVVQVANSEVTTDTNADSASSDGSAGIQHPDPESDAEHAESSSDEEEDQDEEDGSDDGSTSRATLPTVERSYAIPILPVSRQEMQSPGLVLGVPSHGLPGLVATVFESAHPDCSGCALVPQILDMQVSPLSHSTGSLTCRHIKLQNSTPPQPLVSVINLYIHVRHLTNIPAVYNLHAC